MSTLNMNSTAPEEDQKDSSVLSDIQTPRNFAECTAADFGISVESFIPASVPSQNRKEKSRLAQLKMRRRSNIGVRGSPETNSLIRFIAQQRAKTPPAQATPELGKKSPFMPLVASTLRQKIACFQSLMGVEESEGAGGCITTRDDLSDGKNLQSGKENHPPSMTLPPNKKRRLGPTQGCGGEITENDHPPPNQLEEKPLLSDKIVEAPAQAVVISPPFPGGELSVSPDSQLWSPTDNQQEVVLELERIQQPLPDDTSIAAAMQPASHLHSPSISSLLEMKPSDSLSSPTVKKKKQVRFGEPLPPELFDKTLPPSTPLKKGGTPARILTPGDALKMRSLLKTPQRADSPCTYSPSTNLLFASPVLSMPRGQRIMTSEEDTEEMSGKIPFPMDEIELEAAIAEESLNAQPLKLDTAFNEDSLSLCVTECETKPVESGSPADSQPPEPEEEHSAQTDTEAAASGTRTRRGKATLDTAEATCSSGRKRKLPEESEPVKRSSRSAAKTASGKMKASAASRRWNKKVDRTLYGSREYASKNPSLSPITERLSMRLFRATEEHVEDTVPSQEPCPNISCKTKFVGVQRTRRRSGSKGTGRALKGRKVSVSNGRADAAVHDRSEASYAQQDETEELSIYASHTDGDARSDISAMDVFDTPTAENEESASPAIVEATTSFFQSDKLKRASVQVKPSPEKVSDEKMSSEVERRHGEQALSHQESALSRPDEHKAEVAAAAAASLPPWHEEFNFEDVFKPVPTRGQRSVRRSLRNQSNLDPSSSGGLAWLPHVSPESIKESRRRTRGRRLSATLHAPALEVTQP
ncbi:unnamed protein product [Knipowitschia caucasica]